MSLPKCENLYILLGSCGDRNLSVGNLKIRVVIATFFTHAYMQAVRRKTCIKAWGAVSG